MVRIKTLPRLGPREGFASPLVSLMGFGAERGIDHDGNGEKHDRDGKIKELHNDLFNVFNNG